MDLSLPRDLSRNLPSSDDLIHALGLRRNTTQVVPSVALFGAGLLVGAGLALLFAPTTGRELRDGIGERATELRDRVATVAETAADATS